MTEDDDFTVEPVRGLPELLPAGERMLWQGAPDWRAAGAPRPACRAGRPRISACWRSGVVARRWAAGDGVAEALCGGQLAAGAGARSCVGVLALLAWAMARATVYTITDKRVACGSAWRCRVTVNLPYRCIGSADLARHKDGSGDIALDADRREQAGLADAVAACAGRGTSARPQPALRAIRDAAGVAALLAEAMRADEAERLAGRVSAGPAAAGAPVAIAAE